VECEFTDSNAQATAKFARPRASQHRWVSSLTASWTSASTTSHRQAGSCNRPFFRRRRLTPPKDWALDAFFSAGATTPRLARPQRR